MHVSKNDGSGGAARGTYLLHKGLLRAGHESMMLVESRTIEDPSISAFMMPMNGLSLFRRRLRGLRIDRDFSRYHHSRPTGYELFSDDRSAYAATLLGQIPACRVINLHWIRGFVDYQTFFTRVPRTTPIVWTLHDLNPLTGGCHYDLGCDRYATRCDRCPQLGSSGVKDLSRAIWERKRRLFARVPRSRLHLVATSRWVAGEVRRSPIFGEFPVHVIPFGLDLEDFAPRDRGSARDLLGIPQDARVLLFVAEDIGNRRKGFAHLIQALSLCATKIPNLLLLSVGKNRVDVPVEIRSRHLGSVSGDRFLSIVYSAADLFATCPVQEAFGLTVIEAMACGIPVVGYAVGGLRDTVRVGENGLTVPASDVDALAGAIAGLLNDRVRCAEMGTRARRIVLEEYSLELLAQRYSELYASIA